MRVLDVGRENNEFQHLDVLKRNRTKRKQYGEIFVEGTRPINALVASGWRVHTIAFNRERSLSRWAEGIIERSRPQKLLRLTAALMAKLSDRTDPSELIVVAERRVRTLEEFRLDERMLVLVFDRPSNLGNLGSILRSADAMGVTGLVTTGHSVDLYDPQVIRASLGALFTVPAVHLDSLQALAAWIARAKAKLPGMKVVGASVEGAKPVFEIDLTGPLAFILGNEASGISRGLAALADEHAVIPMTGTVDSLNVACAGTVMLYEAMRQRHTSGRNPAVSGEGARTR